MNLSFLHLLYSLIYLRHYFRREIRVLLLHGREEIRLLAATTDDYFIAFVSQIKETFLFLTELPRCYLYCCHNLFLSFLMYAFVYKYSVFQKNTLYLFTF